MYSECISLALFKNILGTMTSTAAIWFPSTHNDLDLSFPIRRNQSFMEKWLTAILGQKIYKMNLVHLEIPVIKKVLQGNWVITVSLQYSLISGIVILPTLFSSLKIADTIQGHLWFHINFWSVCSILVKYGIGILIGIALNL